MDKSGKNSYRDRAFSAKVAQDNAANAAAEAERLRLRPSAPDAQVPRDMEYLRADKLERQGQENFRKKQATGEYKRGGVVRGSGCASRGVKKCKIR
jgi:hypothetical protein